MKTVAKPNKPINTARIDYINIGLMLISLLLALKIPFTSFLIVYAFLGPLHYLTEISWLKQNNFYIKKPTNALWLIAMAVIIVFHALLGELDIVKQNPLFIQYSSGVISALYLVGFTFAIASVVFTKPLHVFLMVLGAVVVAFLLHQQSLYLLFFGALLGTLLHVSLFTFAFVLFGALKNKSTSGYLSLLFYIVCVFIIFTIPILKNEYQLSQNDYETFLKARFQNLHFIIAGYIDPNLLKPSYMLLSKFALRLQFFIAFSYSYHYFNWFSKIEIIKWHKAPGNTFLYIIIAWIVSVGIYLYDYTIGLFALLLLSIIHVFLEFPLNYITFKSIGGLLFSRRKK